MATDACLSSEERFVLHPEQVRIYRAMSPAQKLSAAADLYRAARRLLEGAVRKRYGEWSEAQVAQEVRRLFLHARD